MVQILLLKNPLFRKGLSFPQRLCYLSSNLFWFFPFVRAVFFVAPLLFILFDMKIYVASLEEFVAYTLSYLVVAELIRAYLYGTVRWPWISELYEYIQSVYLFRAVLSVIASPRRPSFNVTAKDETIDEDRLSELALPYFVLFAIFCIGAVVSVYRYQTEPEISGLILVVGAWNLFNLAIAGAALGVVRERKEQRASTRIPVKVGAELVLGDSKTRVELVDMSSSGAKLRPIGDSLPDFSRGQAGHLSLADANAPVVSALPVTFSHRDFDSTKGEISVRFHPEPQHYASIADLMLSDLSMVRAQRRRRQRRRSMVTATLVLAYWAIKNPISAIWVALTDMGRKAGAPNTEEVAAPVRAGSKMEVA